MGRSKVIKALRKPEKDRKEKNGKHHLTDETFLQELPEGSDGSSVYVGEDDLNHIYEEDDIQEALATYQQVRKAIQDQKTQRGYCGPSGSSGAQSRGHGKSKGKGKNPIKFTHQGTKVHVDLLKLRTKCARCGQVGHWARECVNEPDARAKEKLELHPRQRVPLDSLRLVTHPLHRTSISRSP